MSIRLAINGLGRIGRAILKLVIDELALELVAINDLADVENLAYLLRFDTVYGRCSKPLAVDGSDLVVAGRRLTTLGVRDPSELPWKALGVGLVFECTGAFARRQDLEKHIRAGARFVLLSAPSKDEDVETVVHGVNVPGATSCAIVILVLSSVRRASDSHVAACDASGKQRLTTRTPGRTAPEARDINCFMCHLNRTTEPRASAPP